jgi:hypothetical protein
MDHERPATSWLRVFAAASLLGHLAAGQQSNCPADIIASKFQSFVASTGLTVWGGISGRDVASCVATAVASSRNFGGIPPGGMPGACTSYTATITKPLTLDFGRGFVLYLNASALPMTTQYVDCSNFRTTNWNVTARKSSFGSFRMGRGNVRATFANFDLYGDSDEFDFDADMQLIGLDSLSLSVTDTRPNQRECERLSFFFFFFFLLIFILFFIFGELELMFLLSVIQPHRSTFKARSL